MTNWNELTQPEVETMPPLERPASTQQRLLLFLVAALVLVIDHLTKRLVEARIPLNTSWAPWPEYADYFQFTHVANTGAAFGLFPGGSLFFTIAAVIVSVVIIVYNFRLPPGHRLLRLALGLQLGGALGNVVDRFRLGHVTDFFDFGPWAVFNIADASIVTGVIILAWLMFQESREERRALEEEHEHSAASRRAFEEWSESS